MRGEILIGPERWRRWSGEEKRRIVGESDADGATVSEVAHRHDITGNTFINGIVNSGVAGSARVLPPRLSRLNLRATALKRAISRTGVSLPAAYSSWSCEVPAAFGSTVRSTMIYWPA